MSFTQHIHVVACNYIWLNYFCLQHVLLMSISYILLLIDTSYFHCGPITNREAINSLVNKCT